MRLDLAREKEQAIACAVAVCLRRVCAPEFLGRFHLYRFPRGELCAIAERRFRLLDHKNAHGRADRLLQIARAAVAHSKIDVPEIIEVIGKAIFKGREDNRIKNAFCKGHHGLCGKKLRSFSSLHHVRLLCIDPMRVIRCFVSSVKDKKQKKKAIQQENNQEGLVPVDNTVDSNGFLKRFISFFLLLQHRMSDS